MVTTKEMPLKEYVLKGNAACAGCQDMVALRHAHKALEGDVIQVVPAPLRLQLLESKLHSVQREMITLRSWCGLVTAGRLTLVFKH
jgi:pyruvate/2-oxoacid:ferredoxin oxidoreductase beta subunit